MREALVATAAIAAGSLCCGSVLVAWRDGPDLAVTGWVKGLMVDAGALRHLTRGRRWLKRNLEQAGWRDSPERVVALALGAALCLGVLGAALSFAVAVIGFAGGCVGFALVLNSAAAQRRNRLSGELDPLLELFTLELSGGGSALAALGSVCVQVESELAIDLRGMLIGSQVAGSTTFEARLLEYADEREIPALASLATILAASRDYGTAASQGIRALATDLRRAQRRELIAQSRRALNNVLLPAAVAVLLPFLGILMFPAISVLQRSLR